MLVSAVRGGSSQVAASSLVKDRAAAGLPGLLVCPVSRLKSHRSILNKL